MSVLLKILFDPKLNTNVEELIKSNNNTTKNETIHGQGTRAIHEGDTFHNLN